RDRTKISYTHDAVTQIQGQENLRHVRRQRDNARRLAYQRHGTLQIIVKDPPSLPRGRRRLAGYGPEQQPYAERPEDCQFPSGDFKSGRQKKPPDPSRKRVRRFFTTGVLFSAKSEPRRLLRQVS